MTNRRLVDTYRAAQSEHVALIASVDRQSPTGRANVSTVLAHPDYAGVISRVNALYAEILARQINLDTF